MNFWNMLGLRGCFPGQLQAYLDWEGPQSGILESVAHTEPLVRANIASSKETLSHKNSEPTPRVRQTKNKGKTKEVLALG